MYRNRGGVWRYDRGGEYWVLKMERGKLRELGGELGESSVMFGKLWGDGRGVGYVSGNNMYVEYVWEGKVVELRDDGRSRIVKGRLDWVYEEEFWWGEGFGWSGDGK